MARARVRLNLAPLAVESFWPLANSVRLCVSAAAAARNPIVKRPSCSSSRDAGGRAVGSGSPVPFEAAPNRDGRVSK